MGIWWFTYVYISYTPTVHISLRGETQCLFWTQIIGIRVKERHIGILTVKIVWQNPNVHKSLLMGTCTTGRTYYLYRYCMSVRGPLLFVNKKNFYGWRGVKVSESFNNDSEVLIMYFLVVPHIV